MRDQRMDRFSILPFSIGCASHSSVDVVTPHTPKKSETEQSKPSEELDDQKLTKSSNIISDKLQKMVKSFKSLPQVLIQLHREGEGEEVEVEVEMEIGLPTDVQHVAHIGWDGSNTSSSSSSTVTNSMINTESWDRAPELLSFTSLFQPAL